MIIETAEEWYRFTCANCSTWWIAHYEVSRAADSTQSFYRHHGLPCEAPAHAAAICPTCHHGGVRAELLDHPAVETGAHHPASRLSSDGEIAGWGSKHAKFKILVSLAGPGQQPAAGPYPSGTHSLLVRAPSRQTPRRHRYFPAITFTDDGQPLKPGDRDVAVTVVVPDQDTPEFFSPGQRVALWNGSEVGHGTVSRRVFTWPEPA